MAFYRPLSIGRDHKHVANGNGHIPKKIRFANRDGKEPGEVARSGTKKKKKEAAHQKHSLDYS